MPRAARALVLFAALAAACGPRPAEWAALDEVTPAFLLERTASLPALAADGRYVALTWVTADASGKDVWLALSHDGGATFATPVRVNERPGSVWADDQGRPVPFVLPGGQWLVAWSERRALEPEAVDLVVRASLPGEPTLAPAVVVNDDVEDERTSFHGRPAFALLPDGALFAVWADDREAHRHDDDATSLFQASSGDGGQSWSDNRPVTGRACRCCRPAVVSGGTGRVTVAYRGASRGRRDLALALSRDGGTNFPSGALLAREAADPGVCPADGPAIQDGLVAWSGAAPGGGVSLASWGEARRPTAPRPLNDSLAGARHPRLARLGRATLVAVEGRTQGDTTRRVVAVRLAGATGALTPWMFLGADADQAWTTAVDGGAALVAWREGAEDGRIRMVRLTRR